jgi:hypothetical protein
MFLFLIVFSFVFCSLEEGHIGLDSIPKDSVVSAENICPPIGDCYPRYFIPENDFKTVLPGQVIPKGLHVTMDLTTGLKQAKLLTNHAAPVKITIVDSEEKTGLTLIENESLRKMFEDLKNPDLQIKVLTDFEAMGSNIDVGIALSNHAATILSLLSNDRIKDHVIRVH